MRVRNQTRPHHAIFSSRSNKIISLVMSIRCSPDLRRRQSCRFDNTALPPHLFARMRALQNCARRFQTTKST